jgi:hypothetical protein
VYKLTLEQYDHLVSTEPPNMYPADRGWQSRLCHPLSAGIGAAIRVGRYFALWGWAAYKFAQTIAAG